VQRFNDVSTGNVADQEAGTGRARTKSFMSGGLAAIGMALAMSVSAWASQETLPQVPAESSWLDQHLAQELQYDAAQIARFKERVADMPEDQMRALVQRIKAQRELQDPNQADINARDRTRRLEDNQLNLSRVHDERRHGERFVTEDDKKYWNYGAQPRRKYRALFRQRRGFFFGVW
jgi:phage/plasmid primase-like uncharacterized protein